MNSKLRFERILAATDFSSPAEAAFQQAVWLARTNEMPGHIKQLPFLPCRRKR